MENNNEQTRRRNRENIGKTERKMGKCDGEIKKFPLKNLAKQQFSEVCFRKLFQTKKTKIKREMEKKVGKYEEKEKEEEK